MYYDITGSEQSFIIDLQIQKVLANITKLEASPFKDVITYYYAEVHLWDVAIQEDLVFFCTTVLQEQLQNLSAVLLKPLVCKQGSVFLAFFFFRHEIPDAGLREKA